MGKVITIKHSRKEHLCSKCKGLIKVGQSYFRGQLNFHKDIIRCTKCGLEPWEVTTSEYTKQVGQIVYKWQEDYELSDSTADEITSLLTEIRDDLQERLDNMPEQLQESDSGMLLQERIENLDTCIDELEEIDVDDLVSEAVEEYNSENDEELEISTYDELMGEELSADVDLSIQQNFEEKLSNSISDALDLLEV